MEKQSMASFIVKLCPNCGQAWESDKNKGCYYHCTDWPMKSYLNKKICPTCKIGGVCTDGKGNQ